MLNLSSFARLPELTSKRWRISSPVSCKDLYRLGGRREPHGPQMVRESFSRFSGRRESSEGALTTISPILVPCLEFAYKVTTLIVWLLLYHGFTREWCCLPV